MGAAELRSAGQARTPGRPALHGSWKGTTSAVAFVTQCLDGEELSSDLRLSSPGPDYDPLAPLRFSSAA